MTAMPRLQHSVCNVAQTTRSRAWLLLCRLLEAGLEANDRSAVRPNVQRNEALRAWLACPADRSANYSIISRPASKRRQCAGPAERPGSKAAKSFERRMCGTGTRLAASSSQLRSPAWPWSW